jgi:hypothetical protein
MLNAFSLFERRMTMESKFGTISARDNTTDVARLASIRTMILAK